MFLFCFSHAAKTRILCCFCSLNYPTFPWQRIKTTRTSLKSNGAHRPHHRHRCGPPGPPGPPTVQPCSMRRSLTFAEISSKRWSMEFLARCTVELVSVMLIMSIMWKKLQKERKSMNSQLDSQPESLQFYPKVAVGAEGLRRIIVETRVEIRTSSYVFCFFFHGIVCHICHLYLRFCSSTKCTADRHRLSTEAYFRLIGPIKEKRLSLLTCSSWCGQGKQKKRVAKNCQKVV